MLPDYSNSRPKAALLLGGFCPNRSGVVRASTLDGVQWMCVSELSHHCARCQGEGAGVPHRWSGGGMELWPGTVLLLCRKGEFPSSRTPGVGPVCPHSGCGIQGRGPVLL